MAECYKLVYWWDGEYEGNCELPEGHEGPHYDGMSWFNDDNEEVDEPAEAERIGETFDQSATDYARIETGEL